jgi:hypothetical protein
MKEFLSSPEPVLKCKCGGTESHMLHIDGGVPVCRQCVCSLKLKEDPFKNIPKDKEAK